MKDILQCAWKSLSRKRLRTLLTVSGIMVGVIMVVIVSAISTAGKRAVNAELDSMGMNGLSVSMESGTLSMENLEVIRRLSGVETAMPLMIEYSTSLLGSVSDSTLICGHRFRRPAGHLPASAARPPYHHRRRAQQRPGMYAG